MNVKNLNASMVFDIAIVITLLEEDVIVDNIEGLEDDDRLRLQIIRQVALSIFGVLMILLAVNIRIEWLVLEGILPRKRLRS